MRNPNHIKILLIWIILINITGCSAGPRKDMTPDQVVMAHFEARMRGDYERARRYVAPNGHTGVEGEDSVYIKKKNDVRSLMDAVGLTTDIRDDTHAIVYLVIDLAAAGAVEGPGGNIQGSEGHWVLPAYFKDKELVPSNRMYFYLTKVDDVWLIDSMVLM